MDDPEAPVLRALEALGLPYQRLDCDPEAADTAAFCARYGFSAEESANTILVASKKEPRRFAVCVVLASTSLDVNHKVRELLGVSRLSFASAEETVRVTGMMVGGVTPFGLPAGLPVYVDQRVMERPLVILGGGGRSSKIRMAPEALRAAGAAVVEGLAYPREAARA
ncbi:MAG TPA: YbaK/EbsC family protein [Vicinamibacteria bacterium]|jgi:prolyl-tRNA editing enzyme YbaK/EbsC (Cys-tRNA(Pro) deacylase)